MHCSGKFVLRVTPQFHKKLSQQARAENLSLNKLCVRTLEDTLENKTPLSKTVPMPHLSGISKIVESCIAHWKNELIGIVLFGSAARGEMIECSDIDLLIVLNRSVPLSRNLYSQWKEKKLGSHTINPQIVYLPETPLDAGGLWFEVAIDGQVLFEHGHEITNFLRSVRETIACGDVIRKISHGHPYWIKKLEGDINAK